MRQLPSFAALLCMLLSSGLHAQQSTSGPQTASSLSKAKPSQTAHFFDPSTLDLVDLIALPPSADSAITAAELKQLHAIEQARTPEQVNAAKADDVEEDIFVFRNIFGHDFSAENLPVLAALSVDVHGEEGVASLPLKTVFARPRPYQTDHTLHPVCKTTDAPNSYPSGHTISDYLLAFTMAEVAPVKRDEILARAEDYAHNRIVCGVHYASDLEASQRVAAITFGAMLSNPAFRKRVAEARAEFNSKFPGMVSR